MLIYSETGASLADVRCSCGLKTWQAQMTFEIRRSIGLSCRKVSIASQRQPVTETVTASTVAMTSCRSLGMRKQHQHLNADLPPIEGLSVCARFGSGVATVRDV